MNEANIRSYAALMKEFDLTGLEIKKCGTSLRLERAASAPVHAVPDAAPGPVPARQSLPESSDCFSVTSPIVGVCYTAPNENADCYVTVGDSVSKGQTLCIVEAMKLMNEILAEEDGVIAEVCITNGQVVEYGTELFRIKRLVHR